MRVSAKFSIKALFLCLILAACLFAPSPALAQRGIPVTTTPKDTSRRIALVIGNGAYKDAPLRNPANDAKDLARALEGLGFEVTQLSNLRQSQMKRAIDQFGHKIRQGGVGFFFFAGHGAQVNGRNYLFPIGAVINGEADVEYECVDAGRVLAKMETANNYMNIMVLDACRNNPYAAGFRSGNKGLASMNAPRGTIIAYAASPGQRASDGQGRNSPFTASLLKNIATPGQDAVDCLQNVQVEVVKRTSGKQSPWLGLSPIEGKFYFRPAKSGQPVQLAGGPGTTPEVNPTPPPPAPPKAPGTDDLAALKEEARRKAAWDAWQKRMDAYWKELEALDGSSLSAKKKSRAWRGALSKFKDDNPFSAEDESLRSYAETRIRHWESEATAAARAAMEAKAKARAEAARRERERKEAEARRKREAAGGDKRFTNSIGMTFVKIPAGSFMMGSKFSPEETAKRFGGKAEWYKDEHPQHRVKISRSFYMQTTEVTQAQWKAVMGNNPSHFKNCGGDCPVERVSWNDAQDFIKRLNRKEGGNKYRLPTEAEWEYAARAGSTEAIYHGDLRILGLKNAPALDPIAWYGSNSCVNYSGGYDCSGWEEKQKSCSRCGTHPVGRKRPNAWGLYDMLGNVWEWVQDWYQKGYYSSSPGADPLCKNSAGGGRVFRGGSWCDGAGDLRSANRNRYRPTDRYVSLGFRLARITP